jgi:hypothetical protein
MMGFLVKSLLMKSLGSDALLSFLIFKPYTVTIAIALSFPNNIFTFQQLLEGKDKKSLLIFNRVSESDAQGQLIQRKLGL